MLPYNHRKLALLILYLSYHTRKSLPYQTQGRPAHLEFPPLDVVPLDGDVGFNFAEAVKVKLSHKRAELVVCA